MGKLSRTKGHSFERWVAKELREVFPHAQRKLEYQVNECVGIDIQNTNEFKIQCKAYKGYAPIGKIREVECGDHDVPVLITKGDRLEPMVVLPFKNFVELLKG